MTARGRPLKHDCAGKTFGRLTALDKSCVNGKTTWRCRCSCGSDKDVWADGGALVRGRHRSCGCLQKESVPKLDIIGQRFGMLLVRSRAPNKNGKPGATQWVCDCDCGNSFVAATASLTSGNTKTCGCRGNTLQRANEFAEVIRACGSLAGAAESLGVGESTIGAALRKHGLGVPSDYAPGKQPIELSGETFGRWVVLSKDPKEVDRWLCKCECGKLKSVVGHTLVSGRSQSCGCLTGDIARDRAADLSGLVVGLLTVRKRGESIGKAVGWECKCACGAQVLKSSSALLQGKTQSCSFTCPERVKERADRYVAALRASKTVKEAGERLGVSFRTISGAIPRYGLGYATDYLKTEERMVEVDGVSISVADLAAILGVKEATVRSYMSRGIEPDVMVFGGALDDRPANDALVDDERSSRSGS